MLRSRFTRVSGCRSWISSRSMTSTSHPTKREGDISDSFVSLSGDERPPLPDRFRQLKLELSKGREDEITKSWNRLLRTLRSENEIIASRGPNVVPQVEYKDLDNGIGGLKDEIKKRGAVVVRGVVPEGEARGYKEEIEEYVRKNPSTRGPSPSSPIYILTTNTAYLQHSLPATLKSTNSTGQPPNSKPAATPPSSAPNTPSWHPSGTPPVLHPKSHSLIPSPTRTVSESASLAMRPLRLVRILMAGVWRGGRGRGMALVGCMMRCLRGGGKNMILGMRVGELRL